MQPEEIAPIIVLILIFGATGFFAWERHTMCVAFIEGDLLRYHANVRQTRHPLTHTFVAS